MNINFEYYKIFYIIAKNKNITKAANELKITQPAISRLLKTMEEQMNTKLFIRKTNGVILTPEGKELYKLINKEIANIMTAENDFSKIINNKNIKIATNSSLLNYLIKTKKLDYILKCKQNITFLNTNNYDLLNNQIVNNLIDFAFITEPLNYTFSNSVKFTRLGELHLILVSNSKSNTNKSLAILNDDKFIKLSNFYMKENNLNGLKIIKVDNYENLYSLISNGYANGLLIKEFITDELANNSMFEISNKLSDNIFNIGILYNINNEYKIKDYFNDV